MNIQPINLPSVSRNMNPANQKSKSSAPAFEGRMVRIAPEVYIDSDAIISISPKGMGFAEIKWQDDSITIDRYSGDLAELVSIAKTTSGGAIDLLYVPVEEVMKKAKLI